MKNEINILNLYSGIGGNRKKWQNKYCDYDINITAVEYDEKIAKIYQDFFPHDEVIVTDAHQYLLEHFRDFDFIWASPPCPTHSKVRKQLAYKKRKDGTIYEQNKPIYPDMRLYQEIILLDNYYEGFYCVENVKPFYKPLIDPQILGRHCFWSNFEIPNIKTIPRGNFDNIKGLENALGFNLDNYSKINKKLLLRNCVEPEIGEFIFYIIIKNIIDQKNKENIKEENS